MSFDEIELIGGYLTGRGVDHYAAGLKEIEIELRHLRVQAATWEREKAELVEGLEICQARMQANIARAGFKDEIALMEGIAVCRGLLAKHTPSETKEATAENPDEDDGEIVEWISDLDTGQQTIIQVKKDSTP